MILSFSPVVWSEEFKVKGLIKTHTNIDTYGAASVMDMVGDEEAKIEARVLSRIMVEGQAAYSTFLYVHYENSFSKGEYFSALDALEGNAWQVVKLSTDNSKDDTQLFSLTQGYLDANGEEAYHRLDRLYFRYTLPHSEIRFGRQAVQWGRGILFEAADFINPYEPTNNMRDYREGRDMLLLRWQGYVFSDIQFITVPGRNPDSRDIETSWSAFLLRLHEQMENASVSIYGGGYYGDPVAGFGVSFTYGDGHVRADAVVGYGQEKDYVTAVLNADYEWLFLDRAVTGFVEFYYDSLGVDSVQAADRSRELSEKLESGYISLRDRYYSAIGLKYLPVNKIRLFISYIYNVRDNSSIVQPKIEWDFKDNLLVSVGADLPAGRLETEFGGFYDEVGRQIVTPAKRVYGQVTLKF